LIPGALADIECHQDRVIEAGDHDIVLGEVVHISVRDGHPLIYFGSHYRKLDHVHGNPT
jgi:flavin reductase (DIM6/NTAB) family NADH-FMN oxidoreductase RutF